MAKIEGRSSLLLLLLWLLEGRGLKERIPTGDCVAEGGSDWKKEAGEEGGAMKGRAVITER